MVNDPSDVHFGGGNDGGPTVGDPLAGVAAAVPDVDDGGAPPAPVTPRPSKLSDEGLSAEAVSAAFFFLPRCWGVEKGCITWSIHDDDAPPAVVATKEEETEEEGRLGFRGDAGGADRQAGEAVCWDKKI